MFLVLAKWMFAFFLVPLRLLSSGFLENSKLTITFCWLLGVCVQRPLLVWYYSQERNRSQLRPSHLSANPKGVLVVVLLPLHGTVKTCCLSDAQLLQFINQEFYS